ncbi:MAG: uridine kinase, partial [Mesotoga sp.]
MVLVSITGGSGAGKTSVTNMIFNHFMERAAVLSMDDYYKNLDPGTDPRQFNFDSPKAFDFELFEEHLRSVKENKSIMVPVYSMVTYRRESGICRKFIPKPLIIVEGLLV